MKHEIEWLKYYALRAYREKLTVDSDFYEELVSIGYTKRVIPLDRRCAAAFITSSEKIVEGIDLEKLEAVGPARDVENNKYTALEAYMIIFPEKKEKIVEHMKAPQQKFEL